MPELPETLLQTEFVARTLEGRKVLSILKNEKSKQKVEHIGAPLPATATVEHRGKETMFHFLFEPGPKSVEWRIRFQYGMSGHWEHHRTRFGNKHSLFSIEFDSGTFLEFVDPRRFGRWKYGDRFLNWSTPCPDVTSGEFYSYLKTRRKLGKHAKKLLCEVMLNPKVFNGVGNYMRAESLYLCGVDPFKKFGDASDAELWFIVDALRDVIKLAYENGGGKLFTWKNPLGQTVDASEWLQCYKKQEWCVDGTGRRFWYDPKWICPYGKVKVNKKKATTNDVIQPAHAIPQARA